MNSDQPEPARISVGTCSHGIQADIDHPCMGCEIELAVAMERERCARIAEQHILPGHAIGEPIPKAIAQKIREGR